MSRRFDLLLTMTARELAARYRGAWMGLGWLILAPLLLLAIYTFVFAVIFRARWPEMVSADSGASEFALIVFSGMLLHGFLADCLARAPGLVLGNANFVKKTVFPLEILAGVQILTSLAHVIPTFALLVVFQLFVFGIPPVTFFLAWIVLVPVALFALGLTWLLAALTVYFRDLSQVVGLIVTALFFLSPVLYPTSAVPERLQSVFYLNPLTYAIETFRGLLFTGDLPSLIGYSAFLALAAAFAFGGLSVFRILKEGFADAL